MTQPTYFQEKIAEHQWGYILHHPNIKEGMKNPESVKRLGANWRHFFAGEPLEIQGLMAVPNLALQFKAYLDHKGGSDVELDDIAVYIANKVWEAKVQSNFIVEDCYRLLSVTWTVERGKRGFIHEAVGSTTKAVCQKYLPGDTPETFVDEVTALLQERFDQLFLNAIEEKINEMRNLPEEK